MEKMKGVPNCNAGECILKKMKSFVKNFSSKKLDQKKKENLFHPEI